MKKVLSSMVGLTCAVLLLSCVNDPSGSASGAVEATYQYSVSGSGSQLIETKPAVVGHYCDTTALMSDTLPATADTITYQINGNVLEYISPVTTPFGAVYNQIQSFQRVGTGTGLTGTWNDMGFSYQVVSGALTLGDSVSLNQSDTMQNLRISLQHEQIKISGTGISISADPDYSGLYVDNWNGLLGSGSAPDSLLYNISVQAIDNNTVELKGLTNGETVKITYSANGDMDYTSSDPAHAASHFVPDPTTCPDPNLPDWFNDFLGANPKAVNAVAKLGVPSLKPPQQFHLLFGKVLTP